MRNPSALALSLSIVTAALLTPSFSTAAQAEDVKPKTVTLKQDDKVVLATCQGLWVRITNSTDDFIGHSSFISQADLMALAKKRHVTCKYDTAKKKLKIGNDTRDVIAPDPAGTDSFAFGKVREVNYKGKPYFDVQGLWSGLGYDNCSKTSYGFTMSKRKK